MTRGEWRLCGDGISGFARSAGNGEALWVELLVDGERMGAALASLPEPEGCGFFLSLPAAALEGDLPIAVRIANSGECLPRADAETEAEAAQALSGDIFVDRGLFICGWALDPARSDDKLRLFAEIDGRRVADTVAAARYLRDASANGHGFAFELPQALADGKSHTVHIRDEQGRSVPGSPLRVRSLPKNAADWLRDQKKIDKPLQNLLAGLLENLEERLPGLLQDVSYEHWKKAFPVPPVAGRQKGAIAAPAQLLKGQQGADLKPGADFVLLPGNAASLNSHALAHMLATLRETGADLVYADAETAAGAPVFKPCFDREAFLANDYLGPVLARAQIVERAGKDEPDRFATIMRASAEGKIAHLPQVLSRAGAISAQEDRGAAISAWLAANYPGAVYEDGMPRYALARRPAISIIIPTRDHGDMLAKCLASLEGTDWPDYEIVLIDNGTVEDDALHVIASAEERANVCVLRRPGVFNYAALNNDAALHARGELLCFLNNDTEALDGAWLAEMATLPLMANEAGGACGARLLWENGLVQHGGVVVGTHKLAAHVGNYWLGDEPGYMGRNLYAQEYSAVTAACLLTPKKLFLESGGFDPRRFPIAFNDVDYCLRIRQMGKKIFWTPRANLLHFESASRGQDRVGAARARAEREMRFFRTMWGHWEDPFYNPNLPLSAVAEPFMGLAFPPRPRVARIV